MQNFHEHKLWQESFVALMEIHDVIDSIGSKGDNEITEELLEAAQHVAAKIADGLSRNDHRIGKELIFDSIGLVAITRTQLAVAWGRGILSDDTLKKLDEKYANLSNQLQNYR